jgi:hypothetical protein
MKKENKKDPMDILKDELKKYSKKGVRLSLQGKPSNAYNIIRACKVSESKATYMRDYIADETGKVKEIDFQLVKPVKKK